MAVKLSELEEALTIKKLGQEHPELWIPRCLNFDLFPHQAEIVKSVFTNRRTAVRSCTGIGKSRIAAGAVIGFLYNFYPSTVLTTSSGFKQLENVLWREIETLHKNALIPLNGHLMTTEINLASNWFAIGISTDHIERFTGFHNKFVLVVADEASGLDENVYAAIENPLATGDTHLLLIGNPTQPVGGFRRAFDSEFFTKFHISCFDTPNFTHFGITIDDIRKNTWAEKIGGKSLPAPMLIKPETVYYDFVENGEHSYHFQVFSLGQFPQAGVNSLFNLADIETAFTRGESDTPTAGMKVVSLDVARYGDDETIYGERVGDRVVRVESWSHQDTVYTAGRTLRMAKEFRPSQVIVDSVGVGGGVVDMLQSEHTNLNSYIVQFNSGERAKDKEQFGNRRAECYWDLSKRFQEGRIALPKGNQKAEKLKAQLCDIRYTYDKAGKLWIESKEEMRARGMKSPDAADMLMMLFSSGPVGIGGITTRTTRYF